MRPAILAILFFVCGLAIPAVFAEELKIGLIPEQNVFRQMERYKPLGDYIESKTGVKIRFTILTRYGNIIERFTSEELDGAFWGSFTGAMAIKKLDVEPLARPVWLDGTSTYHGHIFVRKDAAIRSVEDMRGKTIVFVDKATTAGYVFPMAYFHSNGVTNTGDYFQEHYFAGSHDAAIRAVFEKKADVGCAKNTIYQRVVAENPKIGDELVILADSPDVPSNALAVRESLAREVKERLTETLLSMHEDSRGRNTLAIFGATRFLRTTQDDYEPVFELSKRAGIDAETYEYLNE